MALDEPSNVPTTSITKRSSGDESATYSGLNLARTIKTVFRRSSDHITYINTTNISTNTNDAGPLTYSNSFWVDVNEYTGSKALMISNQLSHSCKLFQTDGIILKKITRRKQKAYRFKLGNHLDIITWKNDTKILRLDSVKDIRIGEMATNYREEYGISDEFSNVWMTIIYNISKNKLKALHLMAENTKDFDLIFNCIFGLVKSRKELMESISVPDNEKFANIHWHTTVSERKEDESKDTLSFEDVKKLCDRFHIYCSSNYLQIFSRIADVNQNDLLNFQEFQSFVKLLKKRREIENIWNAITNGSQKLSLEQFRHFVIETQNEYYTKAELRNIFKQYMKKESDSDGLFIDEEGFIKYLNAQNAMHETKEDYTKPLNHYFIASSHNTYLLGKQYGETASVEGYIQVLQRGCRCVEIDIWDDDSGPVVCHGFLTTAIPLRDVIDIIRKYAFIVSSYPLIISLEINCNKENQRKTSMIIKELLGPMIYYGSQDPSLMLPSPKELKHKIIIKSKKTKHYSLAGSMTSPPSPMDSSTVSSFSSSYESEVDNNHNTMSTPSFSSSKHTISKEKAKRRNSNSSMTRVRRINLKNHIEVIHEMLEISAIHGLKFRNFSLSESKATTHCFSLNEKKLDAMSMDKSLNLSIDKHNRKYLMRVYPNIFRYKSSNFNPIKFWKSGCQMVALNWQTKDLGQQINLAMFQLTNQKDDVLHSGYILKPPTLLPVVSKAKEIPILYENLKKERKLKDVTIQILSVQLLPNLKETKNTKKDETFGSYVIFEYIDDEEPLSFDVTKNGTKISSCEASTIQCKENGFNPTWETELKLTLNCLDFTFIKFTVMANGVPLATSCLKLSYLKSGYRHIPLYSLEGEQYIFSTMFIYTKVIDQ
ncbi:phosphatidylinositol phospholipase C NDAI_0I02690 [Naumovozyma dairenensis CBS 421]|uniref:Phosphoinositide phospholipase C n=1 Tax=Naumovozyma dairenensis (strain ATCC 10597 / BCRC 20456 / CBS 421 / NBRC 0211 / NRRL Y-12639) TaxID=1071378 RepID=G0WGC6_NAUDC|nr:hypothetical protein NDAI_0I02690 [Naumovozyma dairenensis CBS 421]CCD26837.1 hypothetical protein NDAI_0I02690 [Naumovozyma dairenensis CBS 421]